MWKVVGDKSAEISKTVVTMILMAAYKTQSVSIVESCKRQSVDISKTVGTIILMATYKTQSVSIVESCKETECRD